MNEFDLKTALVNHAKNQTKFKMNIVRHKQSRPWPQKAQRIGSVIVRWTKIAFQRSGTARYPEIHR